MDEGYELNGKVLTNTYREWKDSVYGKNNVICQNCHMPDRKHLWKGIHDPDMVKNGITIDAKIKENKAMLVITNTGVGHYFPTYATPLVVLKGFITDKKGVMLKETLKTAYIGRQITIDLSQELFDTRIAPEKRFEFEYSLNKLYNGKELTFEVWVYPDEFYNRFFKEILKDTSNINIKEIEAAIRLTETSAYLLYKNILKL